MTESIDALTTALLLIGALVALCVVVVVVGAVARWRQWALNARAAETNRRARLARMRETARDITRRSGTRSFQ